MYSSAAKCKVATCWTRANIKLLYQQPSYTVHFAEDLAKFEVKSRSVLQTAAVSSNAIHTVDQSHSADHLANVQKMN